MPRVSPFPMLPVPEALEIVLREARPLATEHVALQAANGRVLAEDVAADDDLPALPRSAVDGYAVRSDDRAETRRVLEEVTAGRLAQGAVEPGTAVHIMTGGSLPAGADAVVMVEDVDESDGVLRIHRRPAAGDNVHPPGLDLRRGQRVLEKGRLVGPAEVGVLATVGKVQVAVYRRPRVAVLATGDELVEPSATPPPGMLRDSNRFALMAAASDAGAEVVWNQHGRDDEALLERLVREGLAEADVLLTSGGVSMGTRDLIKPIFEHLAQIQFGRIAFRPGKPLTFATSSDGKLLFGLPGFPVSSLVTFEVFVRPALRALGGYANKLRPRVQARLGHDIRPDATRLEYQRAHVRWDGDGFVAETTGVQASSRLLSIVGANALLEIAPSERRLERGSMVQALLLADL